MKERDSFQLSVGVFDTCLVWYLLVLPSQTLAVANMTSLRALDGDVSYRSRESFSLPSDLLLRGQIKPYFCQIVPDLLQITPDLPSA